MFSSWKLLGKLIKLICGCLYSALKSRNIKELSRSFIWGKRFRAVETDSWFSSGSEMRSELFSC